MSNQSSRVRKQAVSAVMVVASIIIIVTLAIGPLLTPMWVAFEQDRAQAQAWTGFSPEQLRAATNAILADLVIGPPDFDVAVDGVPVLNEREQGHMSDVRTIFLGVWVAAAISAAILVLAARRARTRTDPTDTADPWEAVALGAKILAIAVVALGIVAVIAFDALFSVFHRLLFAAGSYTFDPGTERLVQLFPFQFWQETAIVAGIIILVLCAAAMAIARHQRRTVPIAR